MAKVLYLVRHAKSSWSDMSHSDFDRPLNRRGLRDAPEMGRRLKERNVRPDVILCSPAQRTRQTVELLARQMGIPLPSVRFEESIYAASVDTLIPLITSLPDHCASAMIIGHNPAMGWLANQFADSSITHMPTCAVATLELATSHWSETGSCPSRLLDFDFPKK